MKKKQSITHQAEIENRIITLRSMQVMIDSDLADMYGVETKRLNEQVRRNLERFPVTFRFQLTKEEKMELVANCDRFKHLKHSSSLPYAFSEQGVAMLSAVLHSETAIKISIHIMNAFVEMRKLLQGNTLLIQRLDKVERKQLDIDQKFENIFKALENKDPQPEKGVFFEGQVFDAYTFISGILKKAEKSIVIIDNYVDETILTLLTKRKQNVSATIYTKQISKQLQLDLKKHNEQYPLIDLKTLANSHDRFIIIDDSELYHFGASLKDLGKKWFAFSKMNSLVSEILNKLK